MYANGRFECADNDLDANNLIEYLNLNQEQLVAHRIRHIAMLRYLLDKTCNNSLEELKEYMMNDNQDLIQFTRAISSELGIDFN